VGLNLSIGWGTWVAQSVKHPALDFHSGHDPRAGCGACLRLSLSLSLCPSIPHSHAHSFSPKKRKKKIGTRHHTIHLLEWLKFKTMTTPNADKDVGQQELSFIISGNAKW